MPFPFHACDKRRLQSKKASQPRKWRLIQRTIIPVNTAAISDPSRTPATCPSNISAHKTPNISSTQSVPTFTRSNRIENRLLIAIFNPSPATGTNCAFTNEYTPNPNNAHPPKQNIN